MAARTHLPWFVVVLGGLVGFGAGSEGWAKDETWRLEGAAAFTKGKKEGVVVSDLGVLRLGASLYRLETPEAARIWDLALGPDQFLYAATGDGGQLWRRGPGAADSWDVIHDDPDSQMFTVAVGPGGQVAAGTGPGGRVISIARPGDRAVVSHPGPDVKYVWDVAFASDGTLYAATGPSGQLWKRGSEPGAEWVLAFDSPQAHLLCLAVAADSSVYTGSDGAGVVYRVAVDGKTSVVLDAPQDEIRVLSLGPDGALYAGTASGGPAGTKTAMQVGIVHRAAFRQDAPVPAGTARLKPGAAGENVVYRIDSDGLAREIFREKAVVHSLAWRDGHLLVGTGPEGRLFEVRGLGQEVSPIARVDHGQILSLVSDSGGQVWLGAGDPGGVYRVSGGDHGVFLSEPFDTRMPSRFGAWDMQGSDPGRSRIDVRFRTGNVGEPDATWSDWVAPTQDQLPSGRFVQCKIELQALTQKNQPEVRRVSLAYRTRNQAPELGAITIPDLAAADGTTRKTRLELKWDCTDPNDDELAYRLAVMKEGWPEWIPISGELPLTEKTYAWDSTAFPSGLYRLRVTASDRPGNPPNQAIERQRTSDPFLVDHDPPSVSLKKADDSTISVALTDQATRLVRAEYALDGGPWASVFPDDGHFDQLHESLTLPFQNWAPGLHVLMVRTTDAAGNQGSADLVLTIER